MSIEEESTTNINVQSVNISQPPEFNPDSEVGASLATRWITWMEDFEMFLTASGIKDETQKRALLLYQAGSQVREIFRQLTDTGNANDYKTAKDKLREYFEPQKNRRYEVFKIIINGISSRIRKKALREPDYDLKQILLDGRRAEQCEFQARDIESKDEKSDNIQQVREKTCHYCGGTYPHKGPCPAKGKECRKCGKSNHFAKVCRGKLQPASKSPYTRRQHKQRPDKKPIHPIHQAASDSDSTEDYLYTVHTPKKSSSECQIKNQLHGFLLLWRCPKRTVECAYASICVKLMQQLNT
jgi:hypothetical protein